jgi:hypothetical protein
MENYVQKYVSHYVQNMYRTESLPLYSVISSNDIIFLLSYDNKKNRLTVPILFAAIVNNVFRSVQDP